MARTFTIAQIKDRCLRRADMTNTSFITTAELLDLINEAYAELYDTIVGAFQNYYTSTSTISLVAGTASYSLPSDFYKLISASLTVQGQQSILFPYNELDRNATLSTSLGTTTGTITLRYIPAPTVFTSDLQTIDGIAGWEALLVNEVAIMMLDKEESNTDHLERRRQRILARITGMAQNRDVTQPGRVTDVTVYSNQLVRNTLQYRFYGNNIEFLEVTYT